MLTEDAAVLPSDVKPDKLKDVDTLANAKNVLLPIRLELETALFPPALPPKEVNGVTPPMSVLPEIALNVAPPGLAREIDELVNPPDVTIDQYSLSSLLVSVPSWLAVPPEEAVTACTFIVAGPLVVGFTSENGR